MARGINRLSETAIAAMNKPGVFADGLGLYVECKPSGTKAFVFRFMLHGKVGTMGLGPCRMGLIDRIDLVSLDEARVKALSCRAMVKSGIDPLAVKRAAKVTAGNIKILTEASSSRKEFCLDDNGNLARFCSICGNKFAYSASRPKKYCGVECTKIVKKWSTNKWERNKKIHSDNATANLTFLQLADEMGKLTNE